MENKNRKIPKHRVAGSARRSATAARYRAQYKGVNKQPLRSEKATNSAEESMTYDDYLASLKQSDPIINVEEASRRERINEYFNEYVPRLREMSTPYIHRIKQLYRRLVSRFGRARIIGATSMGLVLVIGGISLLSSERGQVQSVVDVNSVSFSSQPDFSVATSEQDSERGQVFFDPDEGVASYETSIAESRVFITQQPLTEEQFFDPEATLVEVAQKLGATSSFQSASNGTVFLTGIGEDQNDPQTALFTTDLLLIIIRTEGGTIAPNDWAQYIDSVSSS